MGITGVPGRVLRTTSLGDCTIVTVSLPDGPADIVVRATPDHGTADAAVAGLRRVQWVRLHLDAAVPHARLAGTTRAPQLRPLSLAAGLAMAERGVPTFVVGEGS